MLVSGLFIEFNMKPTDFLGSIPEHNSNCGIFFPPTPAQKALDKLIDHFLGEDWYTVNPVNTEQVNTEAVIRILEKCPNKKSWINKLGLS